MGSEWCSVSAPASARLMGEHVVLRGGPALSFALTPRMTVAVSIRKDASVCLESKFGFEECSLTNLTLQGSHSFMKAAIQECLHFMTSGVNLKVVSDFEHTVGLGSSAAITVATLGVLQQCFLGAIDKGRSVKMAQHAIRAVQGEASGLDAAASVYGGVVYFYAEGCLSTRISDTLPLYLSYSGMKTPTKEVIALIRKKEEEEPDVVHSLFSVINYLTQKAARAIKSDDMMTFGACLNEAHGCMVALGLENRSLASLRGEFLSDEKVLGCKISGSGLGDCVVLLGDMLSEKSLKKCLEVRPESCGVRVEV